MNLSIFWGEHPNISNWTCWNSNVNLLVHDGCWRTNPSTPEHLGGIHSMCLGHTLGYPKHLPSIQDHQAVGKWVRIWTNLLPLPCCGLCKVCGKSSCFPCGLWLARLHIFILTASVVGYITPAARLSKVLVGIRFAALNLYCLLLSRCCVSKYVGKTFWMHSTF